MTLTEDFIERVLADATDVLSTRSQISGYKIGVACCYNGWSRDQLYAALKLLAKRGQLVSMPTHRGAREGLLYALPTVKPEPREPRLNKTPAAYRPSVFADAKAPSIFKDSSAQEREALAMMVRG